jgi:hypothetical protein
VSLFRCCVVHRTAPESRRRFLVDRTFSDMSEIVGRARQINPRRALA